MASRLTTYIIVLIVAGSLVAGLIVGAQRDDHGPVDLVVTNGKVYTGSATEFAEALAVRGNRIVRVGSNHDIKRLARAQAVVVDAHGGTVVPGFDDSHLHFMSGGLGLANVNLLDDNTLEALQARIKAFAEAHPERTWIVGRGWFYDAFPGGLPVRQQLDAVVRDRPAYMSCYDGHTAWVNSKALELAGITRRTPNPKNGIIVKDPVTGEPTGVLKEAAKSLVSTLLPEPTREQRLEALRAAVREAQRFGVTSVQNAHGDAEEFALYDELRKDGELGVRVYTALSIEAGVTEADADAADALRAKYPDDPVFKTGAIKIMSDGVIEAHTASMLAPYANKATTGQPNFTRDELRRVVTMFDRRGWQIMTHAIGDGAVREVLDAYEAAAKSNPAPERGRRHRIEHAETIDAADIPRLASLGVIASQQPYHGNPSPNQMAVWAGNIGPDRASRGWAFRSVLGAGGREAFGSDWPVVTMDPRVGLHVATTRTTPEGQPEGGWYPEQRITLAEAIDGYTSAAAYASFDELRKGRIARDMLADVVILSSDVFVPGARVLDAAVDTTIFDGKVVYSKPAAAATH
jgi:predicted amidohydrolase YtcJ